MAMTDIVLVLKVRMYPYDMPRTFAAKACIQYTQDENFNIIERGRTSEQDRTSSKSCMGS